MTSDRPYRRGLSVSEAVEEIRACAGTQFDPDLVEPFLEALFEMWPETSGRAFRIPEGDKATTTTSAQDASPAV